MRHSFRFLPLVGLVIVQIGCSAGGKGSDGTGGSGGSSGMGMAGTSSGASSAGATNAGSTFGGSAGASAGSGGATAGANTGGTAGTAGASTGGGGPCTASGLIFCETFENQTLNMKPMGAPWLASQCFDTSLTLKVDNTQSHSGSQSLVSQGIPYGACMLHADIGKASDYWVRSWVRFAKGDSTQFSAHEVTVYDLTPTTDTDDPGIRVGFRGDNSCMPTGTEVNITGGEEKTGCTGFQLEADKWYCFELHVAPAGAGVTTDLWIDGMDQSYTIHGMAAQTVDNPSYAGAHYLRLGTRSYSTQYMFPIHVDDIAVGTSRIGCN